ncbi:MAG: hypothetical protein ABIQ16_17080 [Polyangiaceae bacterium]
MVGDYCGDCIEQPGEDCDDGSLLDGDTCPSSCSRWRRILFGLLGRANARVADRLAGACSRRSCA